jgi:hypothetical protein
VYDTFEQGRGYESTDQPSASMQFKVVVLSNQPSDNLDRAETL